MKSRIGSKVLAFILCCVLFVSLAVPSASAEAAGAEKAETEKVLQLRTRPIKDPQKDGTADYVVYSDCYFSLGQWENTIPALTPPVLYQVTDTSRYDTNVRKRVMDLQSVADGSTMQMGVKEIAFVSAAVGGKQSYYENGGDLTPVSEADVAAWKLTIKNPYDEETNPNGMREPEISNIQRIGGAVCFDYKNLYSTGNCYLSAVLLTKYEGEVVAYSRIVDASYRGNGTAVINWPKSYDKEGYVLKVFAEKYNGDNMTDYISDIQYVYQGFDADED